MSTHFTKEAVLSGIFMRGTEMRDPKEEQRCEVFLKNSRVLRQVEELTTETSAPSAPAKPDASLKLIPWQDIWSSLKVARARGNGEMIEVFYDTLFKEAVFDDQGAWALQPKVRR